ncbi:hypothetical protein GDO78_016907 [Eleutherodactylus coqui]|uniref:Uncharacterized protein n=1 Tax=Eleutherodactylus coqui TaxID=57060 RepID=A0A8J6BM88_ELECQ|nr:hypothetical protein GDO78_016907 [Eleutherodactylus coqui]
MVDTNKTHKMNTCEKTLDSLVCGQGTAQYKPCLLYHTVIICNWTVLPNSYHMMIEIGPQYICMVTNQKNSTSMYNLTTPFSGGLQNVFLLYWFAEVYTFLPDAEITLRYYWHPDILPISNIAISLQKVINVMRSTEHMKKHLEVINLTLVDLEKQTVSVADELISIRRYRWIQGTIGMMYLQVGRPQLEKL